MGRFNLVIAFLLLLFCIAAVEYSAFLTEALGEEDVAAQPSAEGNKPLYNKISQLESLVKDLQKRWEDEFLDDLRWQGETNPPIGTIVAYPGNWPPAGDEGNGIRENVSRYWMVCDGSPLPIAKYKELHLVLKDTAFLGNERADEEFNHDTHFTLPNLQGYFLRGVDNSMDRDYIEVEDKTTKEKTKTARQPGHAQADSFTSHTHTIDDESAHKHGFKRLQRRGRDNGLGDGRDVRYVHSAAEDSKSTDKGSAHSHGMQSSGGRETRPVNIAVHWVIKVKSN